MDQFPEMKDLCAKTQNIQGKAGRGGHTLTVKNQTSSGGMGL